MIIDLPTTVGIRKRIVLYIEAIRSNPNGDPDTGGAPRIDLHGHAIISNACQKRVVRDHMRGAGIPLYFERDADLTALQETYRIGDTYDTDRMLRERRDLLLFGGSLTRSGYKAKGALQFSDARSLDPVMPETMGGIRVSVVQRTRRKKNDDGEWVDEAYEGGSMFSYTILPYALFRTDVTFDEAHATRIGLTPDDLAAFWAGITEGWDRARSAHRMGVNLRRLYVFDGPAGRGVEPSHVTGARVIADRLAESPSRFEDYMISVRADLPPGMTGYAWEDGIVRRID